MTSTPRPLHAGHPTRPAILSTREPKPADPHRSGRLFQTPALILLGALSVLGGCSGVAHIPQTRRGPSEIRLVADWNDLDAAVEVAARNLELAPVDRHADGPLRCTWELRTPGDEPVTLTAERTAYDPTVIEALHPSQPIMLHARFGRLGNAGREAALVHEVATRLRQLAGVDYAPLPP